MEGGGLDLFFYLEKKHWLLGRVRFRVRKGSTSVESIRGDRFGRLGRSFAWTRAMRAMSLLFVRHACLNGTEKALRGGTRTAAQTLFNLFEHPERSSAAVPFTTPDGFCHLKSLLEYNNPGYSVDGSREHWIGIREAVLAPSAIRIFVEGEPLQGPEQTEALLCSLGAAWKDSANNVSSASASPEPVQANALTLSSPEAWNACVAEFYRMAIQEGTLKASVQTLARLVPGALQMAFTATPKGEVDFATSSGEDGQSFLVSTMGTAHSHPLIYRCRGEVKAISDVLSERSWHRRDMYQAAKPHFAMEDAIGTDIVLEDGVLLNTCVLRDRRGFSKEERMALKLFTPHFRTASAFQDRSVTTKHGEGALHVLALDELPSQRSVALRHIRRHFSRFITRSDKSAAWPAIEAWYDAHRTHPGFKNYTLRLPLKRHSSAQVLCVPPSVSGAGAIVFSRL